MSERLPSLNALRAFEAVARTGSVGAAADELSVTAGAVSRQVARLEADLNLGLLERDGRGLRLTAAGERCYAGLEPAFAQIARTVAELHQRRRRDELVIAVEPVFAATWLVQRLDAFRHIVPHVDITIDASAQRADTRRPTADLILDYGRLADVAGFECIKLIDEEIFPVCDAETAKRIDEAGSLKTVTLLHYDAAPRSWDWPDWATWLRATGHHGIDAARGPRFVAGTLVMDAARNGQGVALATTSIARDDIETGRLVRPLPSSLATDCAYYLMIPETKRQREDVAAFRAWLFKALAADFPASGSATYDPTKLSR